MRYLYYVINTEYSGVIYANLKDNTIEDGTPFIQTDTLDSAVDYMVSSSTAMIVGFWMLWIVFIGAAVYGFCYLDNIVQIPHMGRLLDRIIQVRPRHLDFSIRKLHTKE